MIGTIREYVDDQANTRPDSVYLIAPEPGLKMTFGQLQQASRSLTHYLLHQGLQPGDKVALLMHNGFQTCRLFIGLMYGGFCVTPLNLLAQPAQLEYVLEHSEARVVFAAPDQLERLHVARARLSHPIRVIECDVDAPDFLLGHDNSAALAPVGDNDDALMMYTSGTTGTPKGVLLPHRAVVAGGRFVSSAHHLGPDDRVMGSLPLYHINAQIVVATAPVIHGGSLVLPHRFSISSFWQSVVDHECTWINLVPTMISYLIHSASPADLGLSIDRVRFCRSASAPLPPDQHKAFEDKFRLGIIETMGLTETAAPCFTNPFDPAQRVIGSPGQAYGCEAKIIDPDTGDTREPGAVGEILVRGPNVMKGYFKNPQETAKTLSPDGWLRTGDLGYLDDKGFLFVTGRIKELIIKGGENIAPREIDEAILKHPAVLEAAAVGIPDEHYGQEIMACVVLRDNQRLSAEELTTFCHGELGRYKTPKVFRFMEELPRGPSGKIQRLKLLA